MAGVKNEQAYLNNLFILFYTLRYLWQLSGHKASELYAIMFPSKSSTGGNKTLYDNILRLKDVNIQKHSERLSKLTGLSEKYFTGERSISVPNLASENWSKFMRLRMKRSPDSKGKELTQFEKNIKAEIKKAKENPGKLNEPFKKLVYFSNFKSKQEDMTLNDLFREIEEKIAECKPSDFKSADIELLQKHQKTIQEYLYRISAVITVRNWTSG